MLILAIDTTGFSASIALVKNGKEVLFHRTSSGFIPGKDWDDFPYFLPQHHQKFLLNCLGDIFRKTRVSWLNIDAIAISAKSGIYNCILTGLSVGETLAFCYKKPLIDIDHILAHIYSVWLERNPDNFQFPILAFSASGSHSGFFLLANQKRCENIYDVVPKQNKKGVKVFIGVGKIFYEAGKRMGILASDSNINKFIKIASRGDSHRFDFKKYYAGSLLDLNFSGFLSLIDRFFKKEEKKMSKLSSKFINDVAASFQESISEILSDKIIELAKIKKAKEIHIAGGISENKCLEKKLREKIRKGNILFALRYPLKKEYRLDNAAMIGALAYYQQKYRIKFINFKPKITY